MRFGKHVLFELVDRINRTKRVKRKNYVFKFLNNVFLLLKSKVGGRLKTH